MERMITRLEVDKMKLKGKPRCPACGNPLSFVYEGSNGFSSMKCNKCSQVSLVNTGTLKAILIKNAS